MSNLEYFLGQNKQIYNYQQPEPVQKTIQQTKDQEIADIIIDISRTIIEGEKELEGQRITFAENARFDTADAFKALDQNKRGYVTAEDLFNFLIQNELFSQMKMCKFYIQEITQGNDYLTYFNVLNIIIPKFDKQAAIGCIARKLNTTNPKQTLSFYLREGLAKLINQDIQLIKLIETKKMLLAQMADWKFMTVYNLVSNKQNIDIDAKVFDQFLVQYGDKKLAQGEFKILISRFNKNQDSALQKDEFSNAYFPSGYLIDAEQNQLQDSGFETMILNTGDLNKQENQKKPEELDNTNQRKFLNFEPKLISKKAHKFVQQEYSHLQLYNPTEIYINQPQSQEQKIIFNPKGQTDPNSILSYFGVEISKSPQKQNNDQYFGQQFSIQNKHANNRPLTNLPPQQPSGETDDQLLEQFLAPSPKKKEFKVPIIEQEQKYQTNQNQQQNDQYDIEQEDHLLQFYAGEGTFNPKHR